MKSYLINLDRRPDRLAAMEGEARKTGLSFTRMAAIDGESSASEALTQSWFTASGPLGALSRYEKCCALSHRAVWAALVESGESHAVVLEDDIRLSPAAASLLSDAGWVPRDADIIKLEHFGPEQQRLLVTEERALHAGHGVRLGRMASRHTGAGAYLISRRAAQRLLAVERFSLPVDHLLFNPNNSPVFAELQPWQMLPPPARQRDFVGQRSDLEPARRPLRRFSAALVMRELVRAGYDARLLPRQLWLLATRKGWIVEVSHSGQPSMTPRAAAMPAE